MTISEKITELERKIDKVYLIRSLMRMNNSPSLRCPGLDKAQCGKLYDLHEALGELRLLQKNF